MNRFGRKGFTLMEMLIVIAIIAILIAIAIPVFTAQLDKAKKGTDQSNARSLKSILTTAYMVGDAVVPVRDGNVYYLNQNANGLLASKDDAMKCEGSGDGYSDSKNGADKGYIWVQWGDASNPAVVKTNPVVPPEAT